MRPPPGARFLRWTETHWPAEVDAVVRPVIADLQFEDATGPRSGLVRSLRRLRGYVALARALALHAITRETARANEVTEPAIKVFPIVAGVLVVLVSGMETMGLGVQDPHPGLFLGIGLTLIVLGVSRSVPRWVPRLVALAGFCIAVTTLDLFRDSDQGTGSLILMPVFAAYAAMSIPATALVLLLGPLMVVAGVMAQFLGRADHGLLVTFGTVYTLLAIGSRHVPWRAPIMKAARALQPVSVGFALLCMVSGHSGIAWDGLVASSCLDVLRRGFGARHVSAPAPERTSGILGL